MISARTIVVPDLPPTSQETHQINGLELHIYADDTQPYLSIKPITQQAVDIGVAKLDGCLTDIYRWMSQNKLKLNADKIKVLVLGLSSEPKYLCLGFP